MTKKLLIDASHAEETRVVVLDGNRLEDFDVETATRKQIKGNIYLAKVIRVEPSLQAAFVEYGGNRHGFLAFGEIHPDYYQIPVADRQRLLAQQAEDEAAEDEREAALLADEPQNPAAQALDVFTPIEIISAPPPDAGAFTGDAESDAGSDEAAPEAALEAAPVAGDEPAGTEPAAGEAAAPAPAPDHENAPAVAAEPEALEAGAGGAPDGAVLETDDTDQPAEPGAGMIEAEPEDAEAAPPESLGGDGDDAAEARERRQRQRFIRNYKIQDVIHRRQIMLIQVVKEERGNKGAALTTYLSLAGRFSVLMPNSPSGGGVSRKITSVADRRRLKEAMAELDVPEGMGLIVRTAGANRPKPEIKRDCEYLLRLWDDIRDRTMEATAPALIYEEASLIKRTIRDVYTRDVEDVLVDGAEGYAAARDFMAMLMPSHARKVQLWGEGQPLFARYQVEAQLDAMLNPIVQLRSGGYIVINQTEALVAIDVNSGRATRERSIEDTALRTNMEAAEEVARQLRMRDLAGLIVIDFIDMEARRNNASVERRLKDSLKNDRARIQVGNISHFGLMEMSRQRLRPSVSEASLVVCPHCAGMGHVRSAESAALHILRAIEDEGAKFHAAEIVVYLPPDVALYLFNHKRDRLAAIEARYAMRVMFSADPAMLASNFRIEKIKAQTQTTMPAPASYASSIAAERVAAAPAPAEDEADGETDEKDGAEVIPPGETAEEGQRRRRRRRRGKRRPDGETGGEFHERQPADAAAADAPGAAPPAAGQPADGGEPSAFDLVLQSELGDAEQPTGEGEVGPARRRRGRGGRNRRPGAPEGTVPAEPATPVYADIADIFEAAERAEAGRTEAGRAEVASAEAASIETSIEAGRDAWEAEAPLEPAAAAPALQPAFADGEADEQAAALPAAHLVQPTVIGQTVSEDAPETEKKRGWWRR